MIQTGLILTFVSLLLVLQAQQTFSMAHRDSQRLLQQAIVPFTLAEVSSNNEVYPVVAVLSDGSFAVVFQGVDSSNTGIFAQLYNADGTANGSRFQVNTYVSSTQQRPSAASLLNGKFVVTWTSNGQDGSGNGVYAQIFNADGTMSGTEFRVNSYTASSQEFQDIATLTTGKFVISWESSGQDGNLDGVYAQIFNEDGTKSGTEFLVNTHTAGNQQNLAVAALTAGKFVITWSDNAQEGSSNPGIYAQIFNSDGTKNGVEFHVNTYTLNQQNYPTIAALSTGRFIIAWQSYQQAVSVDRVYAQMYDADGTPFGSEFPVSPGTSGSQLVPHVTSSTGGGFVVLFRDSNNEIIASMFGSDGATTGQDFALSLFSLGHHGSSLLKTGFVLVVGQTTNSATNWIGVSARSFCLSQYPLSDTSCFKCWPARPYYYNQQCYATCPTAAPKLYDSNCYTACPTGALYSYNQQCYAACPLAANKFHNYDCYATCPSQAPYLYAQECSVTCPAAAPRIEDNVCTKSLQLVVTKAEEKFASAAIAATSTMNASNSFFVLLASLSNMFLYIRYLRINYPENIKAMFVEQDVELFSISLSIEIPATIEDKLPRRPLPDVFEVYEVKSSFLSNLWGPIMTLLVVLAATLAFILFEFLTRKWGRINAVFRKLSTLTKWNMPLLVICGNYCDVIFYLSMEFRTLQFDSIASVFSFLACLVMIAVSVLMLLLAFTIVRNIQQTRNTQRFKKNWSEFALLYDEYKDNSYLTMGYLLIFFGRDTIFNLLIANGFEYPLTQTILLTCLSIAMVVYLALIRPFKSMIQFFQILGNEIMLLVLNISVLILATLDYLNSETVEARNNIGEMLIIINLIFSSANLFFLLIAMIQQLIDIFKRYREARAKGIKPCIQIIKYIFTEEQEEQLKLKLSITNPRIRRESSALRNNPLSVLKSDILANPPLQLIKSSNAFQDLTMPQKPQLRTLGLDLNSNAAQVHSLENKLKLSQLISKPLAMMASIRQPRRDQRKKTEGLASSQIANLKSVTINSTDPIKPDVTDVNLSQIESSTDVLPSQYFAQRQLPQPNANSILVDLNSSDINLMGKHDLSPENMHRFDWSGSKSSSFMNNRINSRKEELGNVDISPFMKQLRDKE